MHAAGRYWSAPVALIALAALAGTAIAQTTIPAETVYYRLFRGTEDALGPVIDSTVAQAVALDPGAPGNVSLVYLTRDFPNSSSPSHLLTEIRVRVTNAALVHRGTLGMFRDVKQIPAKSAFTSTKGVGVKEPNVQSVVQAMRAGGFSPGDAVVEEMVTAAPNHDYFGSVTRFILPVRNIPSLPPSSAGRVDPASRSILYTIYRGAPDGGLTNAILNLRNLAVSLGMSVAGDPFLCRPHCDDAALQAADEIFEIQLAVSGPMPAPGTLGPFTDVRSIDEGLHATVTKPAGVADNSTAMNTLYGGVKGDPTVIPANRPIEVLNGFFAANPPPGTNFATVYTGLATQIRVPVMPPSGPVPGTTPRGILVLAAVLLLIALLSTQIRRFPTTA